MLSPESAVEIPLPAFAGGFEFSLWENSAQFSPPPHPPQPSNPAQAQVQSIVGTPRSSGSDGPVSPAEERRIRRMISNRESARRSRKRKQRELEDLRSHMDRLKHENRQLADGLVAVSGHCLLICRDNDRLRSEATALRRRLHDICRVLIFRHTQPPPPPPPPPHGLFPLPACEPQAMLANPVYGGAFMTETELLA